MKRDVALLGRALALTARAAPRAAAGLGVVTVAVALVPVATVWLTKVVVDRLAAGSAATGPAVAFGALLVVAAALKPFERLLTAEVDEQAIGAVDRRLMDAGIRLVDLHRIERPEFQDELTVLRKGANYIPRTAMWRSRMLYVPVTLLGVLALLAGLHPLLPLVVGAVIVAHVTSMGKMGMLRHKTMVRHSRTGRETAYCSRITLEPAGAKEVRVFGLGPFFLDRFRQRAKMAVDEMRAVRLAQLRRTVAVAVLHGAVLAAGFVYVARRASTGGLTPGDVALYLSAAMQAELTAWSLSYLFTFGQEVVLNVRALRSDAALIILDEPTAGLDPEAEYRLFQRFRELVAGRTAVLISHRFSTVRMADHILVLEDGRVLEAGSHADLVARHGRYAELYEMQAGRYR